MELLSAAIVHDSDWWRNLRERDYLGDTDLDGRVILRRVFRKWSVGVWTGSSWFTIGTGGGHL
jgi:hypothetical protein